MPHCAAHISGGRIGKQVAILFGQFAYDPARNASHQDALRDLVAREDALLGTLDTTQRTTLAGLLRQVVAPLDA